MAEGLSVTASDFQTKVLDSSVPVLVDFWAEWCGPCRAIGPYIEQLAGEYSGKAGVYKLDVDADSGIAGDHGITSIPALLVFKNGKVVDRMIGSHPKAEIAKMIDKAI